MFLRSSFWTVDLSLPLSYYYSLQRNLIFSIALAVLTILKATEKLREQYRKWTSICVNPEIHVRHSWHIDLHQLHQDSPAVLPIGWQLRMSLPMVSIPSSLTLGDPTYRNFTKWDAELKLQHKKPLQHKIQSKTTAKATVLGDKVQLRSSQMLGTLQNMQNTPRSYLVETTKSLPLKNRVHLQYISPQHKKGQPPKWTGSEWTSSSKMSVGRLS